MSAEQGREEATTRRTSRVSAAPSRVARPGLLQPQATVDDRYLLDHQLGRGGFGEVWYAIDLKWGRQRPCALKFQDRRADNEGGKLQEEAEVLLSLAHENIVMLRNYGDYGDLSWLALDYVAGGSLDRLLRERRKEQGTGLSPDEARWLLQHMAQAVDYAHDRGVVHRDIKPGNILLDTEVAGRLDRSTVKAKLSDFGIALRAMPQDVATQFGTVPYMAPELLTDTGPLTKDDLRAADIYALGATIYVAVCGNAVFQGRSNEIVDRVLQRQIPPLRSGDRNLDEAVARAMAFAPKERWRTASAFARHAGRVRETSVTLDGSATVPVGAPALTQPIAFVQRCPVLTPDRNATLNIALANPTTAAIEGRLFLEPADPRQLVATTPDRGFLLRPGAVDLLTTSVRALQTGRHRLRLRAILRATASTALHSWAADLELDVAATPGRQMRGVVMPKVDSGPLQAIAAAFRGPLAESIGCIDPDLYLLPLAPPMPANGVAAHRDGHLQSSPFTVTVDSGGRLIRRIYVHTRPRALFGRVAEADEGANDFVWTKQPCRTRELDPDNWRATCLLSRRAGSFQIDQDRSFLAALSPSIRFENRTLAAGETAVLRSNRDHHVTMGALEFLVRACRAERGQEDLARLLQEDPLQSSLASTVLPTSARHHCLHFRRVGNLEEIEYLMLSQWASIGGGPDDDVKVPGLPPAALVVGNRRGHVFGLPCAEPLPRTRIPTIAGMWLPLVDGDEFAFGAHRIAIASSSTQKMAADTGKELQA